MKLARVFTALTTFALASPAFAVIIPSGSGNDTSPAPFSLGNYVGTFGGFLGTPISSRYFVAANHITSATSGTFDYNNGTGTTTTYNVVLAGVQDDLAIWKIADSDPNSFSLFAPLYTSSNEVGQSLVDIGRGTVRGTAITNSSNATIGYNWGADTRLISWGTNTVDRFDTDPDDPQHFGGTLLAFTFDNNGNDHEAAISTGDSSGPVFVKDPADGVYKLAGVNSLADGNFATTQNGDYNPGSFFDARGYYVGDPSKNQFVDPATNPNPVPSSSYATLISSRLDFIAATTGIAVPEPAGLSLLMLAAPLLGRRRPRVLVQPA